MDPYIPDELHHPYNKKEREYYQRNQEIQWQIAERKRKNRIFVSTILGVLMLLVITIFVSLFAPR